MHIRAARVPPIIGLNAVTVGVSSGADGCVAWRGLCVGVIVVAVGEPCAFIHEEAKPAAFELAAPAVEIVAAKLVNDDNDDEFGFADVSLGTRREGRHSNQQEERDTP